MVIAFIFLVHILFVFYILFKRWKKESISSALIDLVLIIILFSVGWSISTMVCKLFWEPIGFGKHFDRDTISLSILTIVEFFFFRTYYKDLLTTSNGKEK
jgi:hypothetical protein